MKIELASRRRKLANIEADYPDATIIDVTSKGDEPWVKFSPFYPHGNIPVPGIADAFAESVEGVWQGLKVFESEGVDLKKFNVSRSIRSIVH